MNKQIDFFFKKKGGPGGGLSVILYKEPDIQAIILYYVLHMHVFVFYFDLESAWD